MSPEAVHPAGPRSSPTIYDVARAAGVSASTVSRALSMSGRINVVTEQRIRDTAEQLGYQINPMARALPTGRTGTIGLLLSDVTNPVYFDLIRGAERIAARTERTLVLAESQESAEVERAIARRLQVSADGIILVGSRLDDESIRSLHQVKPLILVNRRAPDVPSLAPNARPGLEDALTRLAQLGHASIGYIAGPAASWVNSERWSILLGEAVRRGLHIVEFPSASPTLEGGRSALERVRASGVTAVIAYNDLIALGLMAACRVAGVGVPHDLSIVGFDDIFGADLTTPALSTIRSPLMKMGELAASFLLESDTFEGSELDTAFIERQSIGGAP